MAPTDEQTQSSRRAAVYRLYAEDGTLLYIGSAYDPDHRCKDHRNTAWWPQVARRTDEWFPSRGYAYEAEMDAIASECPKHNIMGQPNYQARQSEALRRRDEMGKVRGQAIAEMHRLRREARENAKAAGVSWREARDIGDRAAFEFLERCGLFPAWVERLRTSGRWALAAE